MLKPMLMAACLAAPLAAVAADPPTQQEEMTMCNRKPVP
jgi:hypothetical protein